MPRKATGNTLFGPSANTERDAGAPIVGHMKPSRRSRQDAVREAVKALWSVLEDEPGVDEKLRGLLERAANSEQVADLDNLFAWLNEARKKDPHPFYSRRQRGFTKTRREAAAAS